jgi:3-oxoacyl-[acyl-carrier protein] reductase
VIDIERLMVPDLAGRIAIVTGAGRGIGRAVAAALARCGARVLLASRREGDLRSLAAEIAAAGGAAIVAPADVADPESLRRLFQRIDDEFRGRLDILVNNAGIGLYGDIADFPLADLDALLAVNVRGVFQGCQEALRRMIPARRGEIINISSVVGLKGYARQAGYTATKHAIVGITRSLAVEAQPHGIRASVVCPGGVDTDLVAAARPDLDRSILLRPEDIARTVLFLVGLPERAAIDSIYIRRFGSAPW